MEFERKEGKKECNETRLHGVAIALLAPQPQYHCQHVEKHVVNTSTRQHVSIIMVWVLLLF